jgi:hypothetical protein
MQELINAALNYLLTTEYGQYATMLVFAMFIVNQVLPHVPPTITAKIPNFIMVFINVVAGRYGNATNKLTDIKGNKK